MRYIKLSGGNGYYGCDWEEFHAVDDNTTDKELDEMANDLARDYAESYEYVAKGYDFYTNWGSKKDKAEYYKGVDCNWKEITEEEYREGLAD